MLFPLKPFGFIPLEWCSGARMNSLLNMVRFIFALLFLSCFCFVLLSHTFRGSGRFLLYCYNTRLSPPIQTRILFLWIWWISHWPKYVPSEGLWGSHANVLFMIHIIARSSNTRHEPKRDSSDILLEMNSYRSISIDQLCHQTSIFSL